MCGLYHSRMLYRHETQRVCVCISVSVCVCVCALKVKSLLYQMPSHIARHPLGSRNLYTPRDCMRNELTPSVCVCMCMFVCCHDGHRCESINPNAVRVSETTIGNCMARHLQLSCCCCWCCCCLTCFNALQISSSSSSSLSPSLSLTLLLLITFSSFGIAFKSVDFHMWN